jgi:hypothetical protein
LDCLTWGKGKDGTRRVQPFYFRSLARVANSLFRKGNRETIKRHSLSQGLRRPVYVPFCDLGRLGRMSHTSPPLVASADCNRSPTDSYSAESAVDLIRSCIVQLRYAWAAQKGLATSICLEDSFPQQPFFRHPPAHGTSTAWLSMTRGSDLSGMHTFPSYPWPSGHRSRLTVIPSLAYFYAHSSVPAAPPLEPP